jgi:signal transduction histidine kinase
VHWLRTPLTQIIGYSALLLEGGGTDSGTAARLATVDQQARVILEDIGRWLAPDSDVVAASAMIKDRIAGLRAEIAEPLTVIIRTLGALMQCSEGSALLDILHISRACTELLAFVQQEGRASRPS